MKAGRQYDIFPRTFKARLLLAGGFLVGFSFLASSVTLFALGGFGDLNPLSEVDVTVENRTESYLTIFVEGQGEAVVPPGQTVTMTTFKVQWLFDGATVQAVNSNGIIVFQENLDLDDLKDTDRHIVIEEPPGGFVTAPPCTASAREACLQPQTQLNSISEASCLPRGRRVCFAPLGQVDPQLVHDLVQYYRDEYALEVGVLTPSAVPDNMTNPDRLQIDGKSLATHLGVLFPADFYDSDVVVIALTPLDLYTVDRDWNFLLGTSDGSGQPRAVVSTYRMHLGETGLVDGERILSRTRKLVTKYLGSIVYGLPPSDDPKNPMFGNILSVTDLDKMEEPLPLSSR